MFERYTEKARRVIFFSRYEASQFGSPYIETEHLLLGLLREDKALTSRFLRSHSAVESIRKQIEQHTTPLEATSTSVDLPLSNESKRVLAYGAEEAERLGHRHIGPEHLLLGLLREEECFAAQLLQERGVQLDSARDQLAQAPPPSAVEAAAPKTEAKGQALTELCQDLTQAAADGTLDPLVGREAELERVIQILGRRTHKNVVLVGELGVGKKTIVRGLAQRIGNGEVPSYLENKRLLVLHPLLLLGGVKRARVSEERLLDLVGELIGEENTILFIEELPTAPAEGLMADEKIFHLLARANVPCLTVATPSAYQKAAHNQWWLEQYFQPMPVLPASEEDAIKVLAGIKDRYEEFHGVTYEEEALSYGVYYATSCLKGRSLPGVAVDIIDEAGSLVKLRQPKQPEIVEARKRIRFIIHRLESAIANHEFEKAQFWSNEEREGREQLHELAQKYKVEDASRAQVTRNDIENTVARWTGMSVAAVRQSRSGDAPRNKDQES